MTGAPLIDEEDDAGIGCRAAGAGLTGTTGGWTVGVEVEADWHVLPMHEPTDVDFPAAALSISSASIGDVPVLLLPEFDPVSYSTMTLECSVRTAISPSSLDGLQC